MRLNCDYAIITAYIGCQTRTLVKFWKILKTSINDVCMCKMYCFFFCLVFLYCCYTSKFLFLLFVLYSIFYHREEHIPNSFPSSRNLFGTLRHIQCWYSCTALQEIAHRIVVLYPDPTLSISGSGGYWWLLSDFSVGQSNEIAACHPSVRIKQ